MNSAVEQGLLAFLAEQLEAESTVVDAGPPEVSCTVAEISSVQVSLHANTGIDQLPEALARIVVGAEVKHEVGALHMADITLLVSTPSKVTGYTDAKHRAIVAAVKALFVTANEPDLSTAMQTAAGCTTARWFVEGWADSIAGDRWQAKMTMKLGLHEV